MGPRVLWGSHIDEICVILHLLPKGRTSDDAAQMYRPSLFIDRGLNSRAGIHTYVEHVSCSTQWTTVFLSEQLCSGTAVEAGGQQQRNRRAEEQRTDHRLTEAGLSLHLSQDAWVECKQSPSHFLSSSFWRTNNGHTSDEIQKEADHVNE